jgi:hypothetical protein
MGVPTAHHLPGDEDAVRDLAKCLRTDGLLPSGENMVDGVLNIDSERFRAKHALGLDPGVGTGSRQENASKQKPEHDPEKWEPVFRKDHAQN